MPIHSESEPTNPSLNDSGTYVWVPPSRAKCCESNYSILLKGTGPDL